LRGRRKTAMHQREVENRLHLHEPQRMSWTRSLAALCGTVVLLTGCGKHETVVASSNPPQLPTHAQPRLPTLQLYVGPEELSAEVARGPREIMTGMMFRTNVVDGDAMLFVLPSPRQFWMMNCPSPLSCAYIDPEGTIQEIHDMEPFNTNSISSATHNILFVLETSQGWFDRHNVRTGMLVRCESGSLVGTFFEMRTR